MLGRKSGGGAPHHATVGVDVHEVGRRFVELVLVRAAMGEHIPQSLLELAALAMRAEDCRCAAEEERAARPGYDAHDPRYRLPLWPHGHSYTVAYRADGVDTLVDHAPALRTID